MTRCATVDEAVQVFHRTNVGLGHVKFVFADAAGNSAIIAWLGGKLNVARRTGDHLVSTNFTSPLDPTDPRNRVAVKVLRSQTEATVDLIGRALSASACGGPHAQTLYSTICDLKKRRVLLYYFHNFEECAAFDLAEQLRKGQTAYTMPSLFEIRPFYEGWSAARAAAGKPSAPGRIERQARYGPILAGRWQLRRADPRIVRELE